MNNQIVCQKCVLDKSANEIFFDSEGICNFCHEAQQALKEIEAEKHNLPKIIEQIKKDGENKKYDVLCGISGGVDSSTALHYAVKLGLRPLCLTMDNGYNNPIADANILKLVETLKVPLFRYVIDLDKFKELQSVFMKGGIMNLEMLTDHILFSVSYELANKYGIKWIISGGNTATESIMPRSFGEEDPRDLYFIKSVYKKMIGKRLTGLPTISLLQEQYYRLIKQIKTFRLLDYYNYNRKEAEQFLIDNYKFESTGEKHCENYFTQWYMNFWLFERYNIDKRKAHFASLINSGQMTRKEAMDLLAESPVYPEMGIEQKVLSYPKKSYNDYRNSAWIRKIVIKIYKYIPKQWKS